MKRAKAARDHAEQLVDENAAGKQRGKGQIVRSAAQDTVELEQALDMGLAGDEARFWEAPAVTINTSVQ